MVVLVTIYEMGFHQAPAWDDSIEGYADPLHRALQGQLGDGVLGDDPNRLALDQRGPVYVRSHWPPGSGSRHVGLSRLGTWGDRETRRVTAPAQPFAASGEPVEHVVLVYSRLKDEERLGAALLEGLLKAG